MLILKRLSKNGIISVIHISDMKVTSQGSSVVYKYKDREARRNDKEISNYSLWNPRIGVSYNELC